MKAREVASVDKSFSWCPFGPTAMPETGSGLSLKPDQYDQGGFRGITERFGQDSGQRGREEPGVGEAPEG